MKVLIDTNVFLDYLLDREPFGMEAKELFAILNDKEYQSYVTSLSVRDSN